MEQTTGKHLFSTLDPEGNSIAIIVKHLAGNMRCRWTEFLTTDGEKPDRRRDVEFTDPPPTGRDLLEAWEDGWKRLFETLESLSEEDLKRTITIRGEAHSVMQAVNRQVAHYGLHVGQIILLARHFAGNEWRSVSVPRGRSVEFNRQVASGERSQR
jgi:hypothetical protein